MVNSVEVKIVTMKEVVLLTLSSLKEVYNLDKSRISYLKLIPQLNQVVVYTKNYTSEKLVISVELDSLANYKKQFEDECNYQKIITEVGFFGASKYTYKDKFTQDKIIFQENIDLDVILVRYYFNN